MRGVARAAQGVPSYLELPVSNVNRAVGTLLSNRIVREFGR